jgi:streptogramin lyase
MGIAHFRISARGIACALAVIASLAVTSSATAALPENADCQAQPQNTCFGSPFDPAADPGTLGSPESPEDDLETVLTDLGNVDAGATGADVLAAKLRGRALAIIEGDASRLEPGDTTWLDNKAYKGLPLLNIQPKVQTIAAGDTTVDVREVRFGDHALLDTSMLRFEDMSQPFTIRWHITELATSFGGELEPAAVKGDGTGVRASLESLVVPPVLMGTKVGNRFHPIDGADQIEQTRLETQVIPVGMPAPSTLVGGGILDPNLRTSHETYAQIAVGPADAAAPDVPTAAQVDPDAPIAQLRNDLDRLDPAGATFAADAKAAAAGDVPLVWSIRSRDTLPQPDAADATADVNVQFANAEAFIDKRTLRVAPDTSPDGSVTIAVRNLDGIAHDFAIRQLDGKSSVNAPGVLSWGAFHTSVLDSVTIAPGATQTITVTPSASAFTLWLSDPNGGDQAAMALALERGPRQQSLGLGVGPVKPLHEAMDRSGALWVSMANTDEVVRLHPQSAPAGLSSTDPEIFPIKGGLEDPAAHINPAAGPILGPGDVQVDGHGIVWVTLTTANAILRIDPAKAHPNTTDGQTIYQLEPCTDITCRNPPVPGAALAPLSRIPLQMKVWEDGAGNTAMAFTEQTSDMIGVMRVSETGQKLDEQHIPCDCLQPLGIALDPSGDIWFTEGSSNALGRLTLNQADPFGSLPMKDIQHYRIPIPNGTPPEAVPGQPVNNCGNPGQVKCPPLVLPNPAVTTLPHSVAVDRKGRVWWTGEASETVGYLDPANAKNGTSEGFRWAEGPINEFNRRLAPADLTVDGDGTVFFSDEYGDQIASATVTDTGAVDARFRFRPTERNSLTDSPLVDPSGNLWFIEGGANLITRVSKVATPVALPQRSALIIANTGSGRLTASSLSVEISSMDVRVVRGGTVVARADGVPVTGQSFAVALPLRGDDTIQLVPHGAHPPAPFSVRVASLAGAVGANGVLTGTALNDGTPLSDSVTVSAGGSSAAAPVSMRNGSFSFGGNAAAGGTISWTGGNASARFRTVTPFAGRGAAPAATPVPAASVPGAGATPPAATKPAGCKTAIDAWLTRSGTGRRAHRSLPLLGMSAAEAERCLGAPQKKTAVRLTYRGDVALDVRLSRGKVSGFTLLGRGLGSAPDGAQVGADLASFRKALGSVARDGISGYRGVVAIGSAQVADVRLKVSAKNRVLRVTVSLKKRSTLDRAGRRLVGSAR